MIKYFVDIIVSVAIWSLVFIVAGHDLPGSEDILIFSLAALVVGLLVGPILYGFGLVVSKVPWLPGSIFIIISLVFVIIEHVEYSLPYVISRGIVIPLLRAAGIIKNLQD